MRIENDAGLSELIESTEATRLCTGFTFIEGPVWVPAEACLLFSDIPNNRIHRWHEGLTEARLYRQPSQYANGLTLDHDGNLLACEHMGRRVSRAAFGAPAETLVDRFEGRRFNSPNDVVVHSSGAIYFTDPTYGMMDHAVSRELPHQGVYRLSPDGGLTCVEMSFVQPNGLAFSPDESLLYVGDSAELIVRRFPVQPDGSLGEGDLFVDMRDDDRAGPPDGMRVDEDGRLWTTGAGGVWVIATDGTRLGVLALPDEYPANLAFGGSGFSTLYLTAFTSLYRVETRVRGIAPGSRA